MRWSRASSATGGRRWLAGLLAAAAGLGAVIVIGSLWLFGGARARCVETVGAAPALRCELEVETTPLEAWQAFTTTDTPRPHYFDAVLQAEMRRGGRWRFVTDDRQRLLASGRVLELDPPRRFVQTFAAADLDDPPSRISVELEPTSGGTRIRLVHDRFPRRTATYRRFRRAHPLALSALASVLETGRLPIRARVYTAIFKPGMKLATVRAEPWE